MRPLLLLPALMTLCAGVQADTLRRGLGAEPDSLDIHQAQGLPAVQVLRDLGEGLVTFDATGALAPGVAENWHVSPDRLTYTFDLRPGAEWSDGQPLTAMDFVRAWQRALAPQTQARTASLLAPLAGAQAILAGVAGPESLGVRADTPQRLVVTLASPTPWFLEILAHPVSFPLPASTTVAHRSGERETPGERPSNGAYVLEDWQPHAQLRLRRNPRYHASDSVALDAVEYLPIEDPGSELSRFRAGELDITETIPPGRHDWLRENLPDALHVSPYLGSFWLGINLKRPPLAEDADLRRALSLAIDRDTLTRVVMGAGEVPAWAITPPGLSGHAPATDPAQALAQGEREDRARALYRRAGYGDGRDLRVELRFNTSATHRRMAVAVSAMWKQVLGAHTELVHEEWKVFVNNRRMGTLTEVFRGGWIADYADPTSFLDLFRTDNPLNNTFYRNARFDALLDQAAGLEGGQRMEALHQAESLLMRDMPVIPLYYYVSRHLVSDRVRGYHDNVRDIHLSRYLSLAGESK